MMLEVLAIFGLGPPLADCEDRAGFAELRENQIRVLVKGLQLLAESAT